MDRLLAHSNKQLADSLQPKAFSKDANIFFTSVTLSERKRNLFSDIYCKSLDKINWYSNSVAEPNAMFKNLPNCGSEFLPQPSAMLVGIDEEERLICEISPYSSSFGNSEVLEYTTKVKAWDFSQTFKSLKFFISNFIKQKADFCQLIADRFFVRAPSKLFLTNFSSTTKQS